MRDELAALASAVITDLRDIGWRWRAAAADLWADDLAREAIRDLCVVVGFLGVVIAAGIAILHSPVPAPVDCVSPQVQAEPEVVKPAATDPWILSPFPLIERTAAAPADTEEAAPADEVDAVDEPETPRRHRRHHRRRG